LIFNFLLQLILRVLSDLILLPNFFLSWQIFYLWLNCLLINFIWIWHFFNFVFMIIIEFLVSILFLLILVLVFCPVGSVRFWYWILWWFHRLIIHILIFMYIYNLMRNLLLMLKISPLIIISRRLQSLYLRFFLFHLDHFI
jgi:hypothetical protein